MKEASRKQASAERAAARSAEVANLYAIVPIGLCYFDSDLRCRHINGWLARNNRIPVEAHIGKTIEELPAGVSRVLLPKLRQVLETGQPIVDCEITVEPPGHPGQPKILRHSLYPVTDTDGGISGISCVVHDVTANKAAEAELVERIRQLEVANERLTDQLADAKLAHAGSEKDALGISLAYKQLDKAKKHLQRLAHQDTPTGLGNRNLFFEQLEQLIESAEDRKAEFALLTIDIDGFKQINERLGYAAGDAVLRQFGIRLSGALTKPDQKFRIGGDEFAVLLEPQSHAFENAVAAAKRIAEQLLSPMEIKGHACSIGVNVGIANYPDDSREPIALLQAAESAVHAARKGHRLVTGDSQPSVTTTLKKLSSEIFQLIYVSTSVHAQTTDELAKILRNSQAQNERRRITGMLIYKENRFMGVLEGEEADVRKVFAAIEKDSRHKSVDTLRSGNILCRDFSSWTMGFENFENTSLPAFTRFLEPDFVPEHFAADLIESHALLLAFKGDSRTAS